MFWKILFSIFCIFFALLPTASAECTMDDFLKCDREIQSKVNQSHKIILIMHHVMHHNLCTAQDGAHYLSQELWRSALTWPPRRSGRPASTTSSTSWSRPTASIASVLSFPTYVRQNNCKQILKSGQMPHWHHQNCCRARLQAMHLCWVCIKIEMKTKQPKMSPSANRYF